MSHIDIRPCFEKDRNNLGLSFICRPVKRSRAVFISHIDIRACPEKSGNGFVFACTRRHVERS